MVNEEVTIIVDRQGRMVLPSRVREKLGVKNGGRLSISLGAANRVIIEGKVSDDIQERVRNWAKAAMTVRASARVMDSETTSDKWMSSEYARRKLGL